MAVMQQLGKPVPDVGIIGHIGKQAFLHWLREIGPKLESRPAKDFLKVRHRQFPLFEWTDEEHAKMAAVPVSTVAKLTAGNEGLAASHK
jgi:hypothetical protein